MACDDCGEEFKEGYLHLCGGPFVQIAPLKWSNGRYIIDDGIPVNPPIFISDTEPQNGGTCDNSFCSGLVPLDIDALMKEIDDLKKYRINLDREVGLRQILAKYGKPTITREEIEKRWRVKASGFIGEIPFIQKNNITMMCDFLKDKGLLSD